MPSILIPAAELDEAQRLSAAEWAQAALPAHYETLNPAIARAAIAAEFAVEGSELANALAAVDGRDVVGLVAGFPLEELALRQRVSLHHLLTSLPPDAVADLVANARVRAGDVPPIAGGGYYLARIGVAPHARGGHVAGELLGAFLQQAGSRDAVLHVHADNARAVAFYQRNGFAIEDRAKPYWIMRRTAV